MLDNLLNATEHVIVDVDNNVLHHLVDEHHGGHDCHMSAHLTALNTIPFSITDFSHTQQLSLRHIHYSTRKLPPPSKPPRA